MKSALHTLIATVLQRLELPSELLEIAIPEHSSHGTYTTNIGFLLGKKLGKNPKEVAEDIVSELNKLKTESQTGTYIEILTALDKIEVVGPGFINITISPVYLLQQLVNSLTTGQVAPKGRKVMVEFTDPNPFKPLHIGHLYSNAVGESIARMFEAQGYEVRRVCYQGDVGLHVGKALYGMSKLIQLELGKSLETATTEEVEHVLADISSKPIQEQAKWLGVAYANGSQAHEEENDAKAVIERYNIYSFLVAAQLADSPDERVVAQYQEIIKSKGQAAYLQELEQIRQMYATGRKMSMSYFESQYAFMGTKFDLYFLESEVAGTGKEIVENHISDGIFEKSNNAIIYRGEKVGLHTRVFVNALGLPTYEAKELGLAPTKYQTWNYDTSVIITAKEINEYFQVLLSAMKEVAPDLAVKTVHIGHGVVRLPEGKMSSRKGNAPTIEGLFELVTSALQKVVVERTIVAEKNNLETVNRIAIAAVKYALLKVALPADITFDLEKSISIEGDSGPYLLYSCVRAKNVLRKIGIKNSDEYKLPDLLEFHNEIKLEIEEADLLRNLSYANAVWEEATKACAPSRLCRYAVVIAQGFNALYAKHKIVQDDGSKDANVEMNPRLLLTVATAKILTQTLYLLGFQTVESM